MELDCNIVTKKSRDAIEEKQGVGNEETDFRIKCVALAEYFEQQTNCRRDRRKMSQSRRSHSSRNQSNLPFLIKQMETMSGSHKQSAT